VNETITARRAAGSEAWITARAMVRKGWASMPRHAMAGRHAGQHTARGRRVLSRVYGIPPRDLRTLAVVLPVYGWAA
jgi:hypothetical protein